MPSTTKTKPPQASTFPVIIVISLLALLTSFMLAGLSPLQISKQSTNYLRSFAIRAMSTQPQNNPDRAKGLIAKSGIELLTFGTPNGHKASILLEELKDAYNKSYVWQSVPIMDNIQKEQWYTKLNPNGRIPTIIDHDKGGFAVMEGSGTFPAFHGREE